MNKLRARTDRHKNPTAFTTAIARQAGLVEGRDFGVGDAFGDGQYHTARLFGDPVDQTIQVIDAIGFYTARGAMRWNYIAIPKTLWDTMGDRQRRVTLKYMYLREGGTELLHLF